MCAMANGPVETHSKVVVPNGVDPHPAALAKAQSEVVEGHTAFDLRVTGSVLVSFPSGDQEWKFTYWDVPPACTSMKARGR